MKVPFRRLALHATALTTLVAFFAAATRPAVANPVMTDQAISDKIDDELLLDPAVIPTKLDVSTADGIVTLTGEVNNILAEDRATRVAQTVKGVRAVVNQIEVGDSATRPDAQIRRDVVAALQSDPATESYKITPSVEDGEVTLSGTVNSFQERELTKLVAKGVRGVKEVDDQIDVDYATDRTDIEIEEEVAQTLRWNAHVDDFSIDVSVNDGEVELTGTVGSAAEKRMAESDARVAGVISVDTSELSVAQWARDDKLRGEKYVVKSQDELRDAVDDALLYDPRVNAFNIDPDIVGSTVTLRGKVDNLKAKRAAEQDVENTVGVSYVKNRLKVRLDTWPDDAEVAESIRNALLRDPYVERFEITVTVIDGTAHLYGTVDSYFEKGRADDVASRISGVLDVENHLLVDDVTAYIYSPYVDDFFNDDELIEYERRAPSQTDSEIKDSIESELWWSPFVDSDEVSVAVNNGVATMTGSVGTWGERRAATENAYEGGATLVENNLVVHGDG